MGNQPVRSVGEDDYGPVNVVHDGVDQAQASQDRSDQLIERLEALPQYGPLLRESLPEASWKALETMPSALEEIVFNPSPLQQFAAQCKDVCVDASRRVQVHQGRVDAKVAQAEAAATTLDSDLHKYLQHVRGANHQLGSVNSLTDQLEELQVRINRATTRAAALQALINQQQQ